MKIFCQKNLARLLQTGIADVVTEAHHLDIALAEWPIDLPEEWKFLVASLEEDLEPTKSDLMYNDSVHYCATHGHAAVWMRFMAVWLIASSICLRLLSALPQCIFEGLSTTAQIKACQENINLLATNLRCSVPFFFNSDDIHHDPESPTFRINNNLT